MERTHQIYGHGHLFLLQKQHACCGSDCRFPIAPLRRLAQSLSLYKNKILLAVIDTVMAEEVINMGFIIGHIALVANTNLWSDDDGRNDAAL